jgi:DNA-binding PadR family transcriptional regulator
MLEQMKRFGIGSDQLDASTLYRNLRRMEASGVVKSAWEAGGPGPKRRVYRITSHGTKVLGQWIGFLENRRAQIDSLVEAYKTGASESHPLK